MRSQSRILLALCLAGLPLSARAMCGFDPKDSPHGWHIIKRLK